jgi:hypothetical protein
MGRATVVGFEGGTAGQGSVDTGVLRQSGMKTGRSVSLVIYRNVSYTT